MNFFIIFLLILGNAIVFMLGRRWESYSIINQIKEKGYAITKWGDIAKCKITGKVEDIK